MDELLARLTELGFGEYEARAYVALLRHNPINGYEVARLSGVPRGSIYSALARLEEKGAVMRVEAAEGTRYAPVAAAEVLAGLAAHFQATLGDAERRLAALAAPVESQPVWNASGYDALLEHARRMIAGARASLLLAVWPQESATLADDMREAAARGVEIRTLCLAACAQECGFCRGQTYRYAMLQAEDTRRLVVVPDGEEVLAGEIRGVTADAPADHTQLVRTRQPLLVDLAAGYVRHSIALALVAADLGPHLRTHLTPETRHRLALLDPSGRTGGWPEPIQRLLAAGESGAQRAAVEAAPGQTNGEVSA